MTLLLLHTELTKSSFEAVAAAKQLGPFVIGLVGTEVQESANGLANAGAERILAVEGAAFSQARYATDAAAAEALVKTSGADVVLAPMTSRWARAVPGVAQRCGEQQRHGRNPVRGRLRGFRRDALLVPQYPRQRAVDSLAVRIAAERARAFRLKPL